MAETLKRKTFLVNTAYIFVLFGLYYLFMRYAFWVLFPFLLAFLVAVVLQRPINFLVRKTKLKKGLASGLCVLALVLAFLGVLSLVGVKIAVEIKGLIATLSALLEDIPALLTTAETSILGIIHYLPDAFEESAAASVTDFFERLSSRDNTSLAGLDFSLFYAPIGGVWSTAKQIPALIVGLVISIIATFFTTADYDRIVGFIKRQMPREKAKALGVSKHIMLTSFGRLFRAYATILFITFCELLIGLNILRFIGLYEGRFLIATALITAALDILPFLGTGTVLIPWGVYALISGNTGLGIALLILYAVIFIIRQFIEPKLVANELGLPPILTLLGMYLGVHLFGFIGLFLVPVSIIFVKILNDEGLLDLWKNLRSVPVAPCPAPTENTASDPPLSEDSSPENASENPDKTSN